MEEGGRAVVKEEGWFKDGESEQVMMTSPGPNHNLGNML